jgi:hypothetical protein
MVLINESLSSADAFAAAANAGIDLVDTHNDKQILRFLWMPYQLAKGNLQLARATRRFHVSGIYIARQALRLVLHLNESVDDGNPTDKQLDERDKLRRYCVDRACIVRE